MKLAKSRSPRLCRSWSPALVFLVGFVSPTGGFAAENRTQVFVVALSDDLRYTAGLINQQLRQVLREQPGLQVLDLATKLQAQPSEKVRDLREKARRSLLAAKEALGRMEYEETGLAASRARRLFEKMGGDLDPLRRYLEAILLQGVAYALQGEGDQARRAFTELLLIDSSLNIKKSSYPQFVKKLFAEAAAGLKHLPRGSLAIKSQPAGANLYFDGKLRGVTPQSLDGLPAGPHLVVLKMPGFANWGRVVRVEAGTIRTIKARMEAGRAGSGYLRLVERAGRAVGDSDRLGSVLALGQTLGLDWVWLCQLSHREAATLLRGYLFEFNHARVAYRDQVELEPSGYGLEEDVRNFGKKFLREGLESLRELREEGDPLDSHTGTEDWYRDDSAAARRNRDTRAGEQEGEPAEEKSGDPLEDYDPTADW